MKALEITTVIGCANACSFCPQKTLVSNYRGKRNLEIRDIVHVLRKLPRDVQIDFSGYAEPYFNDYTCYMIADAVMEGFRVTLFTTLMGFQGWFLLNQWPPAYIRIHVPDTEAMVIDDDKWIAQHELWRRAQVEATYMGMGQLTPKVSQYLTGLGITVEQPQMLSRGGNLWKPAEIAHPLECSADRWHQNVMLPDGNVYGCCMDYGLTVPLGNLFRQSYEEIYDAAEKWKASEKRYSICNRCEWARAAKHQ